VQALSLPDHQGLSCGLHNRFGHFGQSIDFENPLDLSKQAIQQLKVAASDADDRCNRSGSSRFSGSFTPAAAQRRSSR
jgi:hypothetical protein